MRFRSKNKEAESALQSPYSDVQATSQVQLPRVVHLLGGPVQAGAGRGALALHEGLLDLGMNSVLLCKPPLGAHPPARTANYGIFGRALVAAAWRLGRRTLSQQLRDKDVPYLPISVGLAPHRMPIVRGAQILHVQWAHAHSLGPSFWRWLETSPIPVIFTLRDAWPFTGGCHFPNKCVGYKSGCAECPLLQPGAETIASRDFATKRQAYSGPVTFVAISEQIARQARASAALERSKVVTIPNAIQLQRFKQIEKDAARASLGLIEGPIYIAAGAVNLTDPRKGAEILNRLFARFGPNSGVYWLLFGGGKVKAPSNATTFGLVNSDERLNQIYSAADLFLMPSIEESFGKTTVEAMASGTPTLAFRETPAEEIITDGIDGWLAPHGDAEAMGEQILTLTGVQRETFRSVGLRARATAETRYSPAAVARAHLSLYQSLLASHGENT